MKYLGIFLIPFFLLGCGGGSGSGDDSGGSLRVFTDAPSITVTGNPYESVSQRVNIDSKGTTTRDVYFAVLGEHQNFLKYAELTFETDTSGYYRLDLEPGYIIGDGQTSKTIEFAFCYDDMCTEHISGSPFSVKINYEVALHDEITISGDTNIILNQAINSQNDSNLLTRQGQINSQYQQKLTFKSEHDFSVASAFNVTSEEGNQLDLAMNLQLPSTLGVGSHIGQVAMHTCYDSECEYPIQGSPITFDIDYTVTESTAIDNGLDQGEIFSLVDHNILEIKKMQGLDLIVMSSDSPDNAIYVYDLNNNIEHKFPLTLQPNNLQIDNIAKQGRIAVTQMLESYSDFQYTYEYFFTILDIDKNEIANSQLKTVSAPISTNQFFVFNNQIISFPNAYNLPYITYLDKKDQHQQLLNTGNFQTSNGIVKISPNGDAIYSLIDLHSEELFRFDLSQGLTQSQGPTTEERYTSNNSSHDFWISRYNPIIIQPGGNILKRGKNPSEIATYQYNLFIANDRDGNIQNLDEKHDQLAIIQARYYPYEQTQILLFENNPYQFIEEITLPPNSLAQALFYSEAGALYALIEDENAEQAIIKLID